MVSHTRQPHLLSMSATPIPRTLKLAIFGNLEVSQIKEKPGGRKQILTKFVPEEDRKGAYDFIRAQILKGRQAFVITPLIEDSDSLEVKAASSEQKVLQEIFPEFKIGLLHGKMKSDAKEKVMQDFLNNELQILVSTSVIEVGVDVPNASVIAIEGAERFGLAQLHQFRGRVGRAEHQSYAFLFSNNTNEKSIERLNKFAKNHDGFELAEIDLANRGFGNIFGEEQSGFYFFKYFSFANDQELTKKAQEWAKHFLKTDPALKSIPFFQEKIKDKVLHME
jgi:ATP-dependent DNA helicase RecG